jgi:CDP-glucose 4,6-dehydratase
MGTCNLLEAVRQRKKPCVVIVVTSDKCYENVASQRAYREGDAMGGHDPYSASKGAVELLVASYRRSFFPPARFEEHGVKLATVRAGNVIGGGDWARDRIVPDIVSHLSEGRPVPLRNPTAVRPWQHVLAPLHGYLLLASRMLASNEAELCSAWNFGPDHAGTSSVSELVERFCAAWGGGTWKYVGTESQPHEAQMLKLSIDKASQLGWQVVWSLDQTISHTAAWYRAFNEAGDALMLDACLADIRDYSRDMLAVNSPAAVERLNAA